MRIVLIQHLLIGDAIVTTPLLRQIRAVLPKAHVAIVLGPHNRVVRPLLGDLVDEVIDYAKSPLPLAKIWWHTKWPRFDWLIDLQESPLKASRVLVRAIGARHSTGFANGNDRFYEVPMPLLLEQRVHIVERYLSLLKPLDIPLPTDPRVELSLPQKSIDWACENWPANSRPGVLVNVSGTGPDKAWGAERFAAFITAAKVVHPHLRFVVTGHQRDEATLQSIARDASVARLPVTSRFEDFAALIQQAEYVVTPDTSVVHLATAWQRPCLGLYIQRLHDDHWTPYHSPGVKLLSPTTSVADITVDEVLQGFNRLVAGAGSLSQSA